jgi:hypothetical protein
MRRPEGDWGARAAVAPDGPCHAVAAALTPTGEGIVTFARSEDVGHTLWLARERDGDWLTPVAVPFMSGPMEIHASYVAATPDGGAFVIWSERRDGTYALRASRLTGGSWEEPATIAGDARAFVSWAAAHDEAGRVTVVHDAAEGTWARLVAATWAPASGWEPSVRLDARDVLVESPTLAVSADGHVVAAWAERDRGWSTVWWARRRSGGEWEGARIVWPEHAERTGGPQVSVAEGGHAVLAWYQGLRFDEYAIPELWATTLE